MDKYTETKMSAVPPEEKKAIQAVRKALSRVLRYNLPNLQDQESLPDLFDIIDNGIADLVFEIKMTSVKAEAGPRKGEVCGSQLKIICSIENAESGDRGFLFEIEERFGYASMLRHLPKQGLSRPN